MMKRWFALFVSVAMLLSLVQPASAIVTKQTTTVILVSDNESDYSLAVSMQYYINAQIVVVPWGQFSNDKLNELLSLDPSSVIIIGGPKAVPSEYSEILKADNIDVVRLWGQDRVGTSQAVFDWLAQNGYLNNTTVIFVNAWKPDDIMKALAANPGAVIVPVDNKRSKVFSEKIEKMRGVKVFKMKDVNIPMGQTYTVNYDEAFMNLYQKLSENASNTLAQEYLSSAYSMYTNSNVSGAFKLLFKAYKVELLYKHEKASMNGVSAEKYYVSSIDVTRVIYRNGVPMPSWVWEGNFSSSPYVLTFARASVTNEFTLNHRPEFVVVTANDSVKVGHVIGVGLNYTFSGGISQADSTIYLTKMFVAGPYTVRWYGSIIVEPIYTILQTSTTETTSTEPGAFATMTAGTYKFNRLNVNYTVALPSGSVIAKGERKYFVENGTVTEKYWVETSGVSGLSTVKSSMTVSEAPYFSVAAIVAHSGSVYTVVGAPIGFENDMTWTVTLLENKMEGHATAEYSIGPAIATYSFEGFLG